MAYTSPWLNPGPYSSTVDRLSAEAIAIDEGVYQTVLNAQNFSEKYSGDFSIVTQLKDETSQFNSVWSIPIMIIANKPDSFSIDRNGVRNCRHRAMLRLLCLVGSGVRFTGYL